MGGHGKSRKTLRKGPKVSPPNEPSDCDCGTSGSHHLHRPGVKGDRHGGGGSNGIFVQKKILSIIPKAPSFPRREVLIIELALNVRHKNRVLSGTFCVEPFVINCVHTVLEDETGNTVRVVISDSSVSNSTKKSKEIARYAKGRKVFISEPYYIISGDGGTVVSVDDHRDISGALDQEQGEEEKKIVEEKNGLPSGTSEAPMGDPPTKVPLTPWAEADRIRCEGNALFTKQEWAGAIRLYSKCIGRCSELLECAKKENSEAVETEEQDQGDEKANLTKTLLLAYSNRSETWLRLRNLDAAQSDASKALELDPKHVKSLARNGKALYELQRYEESIACFSSALELYPDDQSQGLSEALAKSKTSLQQSRDGMYDLTDYYLNCCTKQPPVCSDFVGHVEILHPEGKMRGLFATEDIAAGELVLVSNAIAVCHEDSHHHHDHDHCHDHSDSDEEEEEDGCGSCEVCQKQKTWRRKENPRRNSCYVDDLATQVRSYALSSTRRSCQVAYFQASKNLPVPPVDLYKPGRNWLPEELENLAGENVRLGPEDIKGIVKENFIDEILNDPRCFANGEARRILLGMWLLPSIMNHSCCANTETCLVGEAMFVRACRTVKAGEELTRSYFDTLKGLERRQEVAQRWPFKCKCERCEWESSIPEPHNKVRKKLCARVHKFFYEAYASPFAPNLEKLASLVSSVEETIQSEGLEGRHRLWIRASLMDAYIANIHVLVGIPTRRIEAIKTVLEAMIGVGGGLVLRPQIASTLLREVKRKYGKASSLFRSSEEYVMELYKPFYGQLNKKAFWALIKMHAGGDGLD